MKAAVAVLSTLGAVAAIIFVPLFAVFHAPWSDPGRQRSLSFVVAVSAAVFLFVFTIILWRRLAPPRVLAIAAVLAVAFCIFSNFVIDDAAQVQYEHSTTAEMLGRVARIMVSPIGLPFAAGYAAMVLVPLSLAIIATRERRRSNSG
jgi:hypothetical protein